MKSTRLRARLDVKAYRDSRYHFKDPVAFRQGRTISRDLVRQEQELQPLRRGVRVVEVARKTVGGFEATTLQLVLLSAPLLEIVFYTLLES